MKHIRMQLAELHRLAADALHPAALADVLCDEGSPDGHRVHGASAGCGFEADAAGVFVTEDAEGVQGAGVVFNFSIGMG